jgi:hypothetical protein
MTPSTTPARGPQADRAAAARRAAPGAALATRAARPALALLLALATACDSVDRLLTIETPSRLAEDALLVPENAPLIVASAAGDFQCAYGSYVVASGLAAGELADGGQTATRWSYDRRDVRASDSHYSTFGCTTIGVYTPLSTARYTNDQALTRLEGWTDQQVPNRESLIASASTFAGYSLLLIGEGFCSAAIGSSVELTSVQLFDSAEVRFTRAIAAAQATGQTSLLNLARVGRARARLNQGDKAGAVLDAAAVPGDFVYALVSSTIDARYQNQVFAQNTRATTTVGASYRNVTVQGQADPRVPTLNTNLVAGDQTTPYWQQLKYTSLTASTILATGVEAQLILAEARGGAEGVTILNALRGRAGVGLPALTAAEGAAFTSTLFEERRRALWLQGTRWYDVRRGNLALSPAAGEAYPKGGTYGGQRCWPLPDVERLSNPNIPDSA